MREAVLLIRHRGEPESDASAAFPDVTLRSLSSITGSASERKRIVGVSGDPGSIDSFLEEFRAADSVREAEPLSPTDRSQVYVALTYDADDWDSISARLTDMGIHYRTGTTITAGWERWTLYLEPGDDLRRIVDAIEAADNDVRVVRDVPLTEIGTTDQLGTFRSVHDMTPRQREVLAAAIDRGYYHPDAGATIEDVARAVGLASSTTWEHLVRAEAKVMAEIGTYLTTAEGRPPENPRP